MRAPQTSRQSLVSHYYLTSRHLSHMQEHRRVARFVRNCSIAFTFIAGSADAFSYSGSCQVFSFTRERRRSSCMLDTYSGFEALGACHRPSAARTDASRSSFWYSAESERDDLSSNTTSLPCDFDLDQEGQLPPGAYYKLSSGNSGVDMKESCRISVALNIFDGRGDQDVEPSELVSHMHGFLDSGLTSFKLPSRSNNMHASVEADIVKRFRHDTPAYQLDRCRITLPLEIPIHMSSISMRNTVLESLHRIGGDEIDCLQLQYNEGSLYHLDALDYLQDLVRDGFVRSVGAANFPISILKQAESHRFTVESNEISSNLLDPLGYLALAKEDTVPLILSSPLAGGLLTDRYFGIKSRSLFPPNLTNNIQDWSHFKTTILKWKERHDESLNRHLHQARDPYADDDTNEMTKALSLDAWPTFRTIMLDTIQDIARKHAVSMASVVLRWTLQLDKVAGTVVACRIAPSLNDVAPSKRPKQLRQVFMFTLDEHDMERLLRVSGCERIGQQGQAEEGNDELLELMERQANRLFVTPHATDRAKQSESKKRLFL
ncbi:hypothetical protein MPSEU_000796700 [Mayamaea pseudoterrestris]|nr:hypothetical protein MPSEU_000796700 [Mayamaea pseudoterrestris]